MNYIDKIQNILNKIALFIGAVLFVCLFAFSLGQYDGISVLNSIPHVVKLFISVIALVYYGVFVFLILSFFREKSEKFCTAAKIILFILIVVTQILYLYTSKVSLRYDALKVLDEAISLCKTNIVSLSNLDGYFARYTNNYGILFITAFLLKIFESIGLLAKDYSNATFLLGIFNIFLMDFSIICGMKLLEGLFSKKTGLTFLFLLFLTPMTFLWTPFYYTNSMGLSLSIVLLYLMYEIMKEENQQTFPVALMKYILVGIVFSLGFIIRATTILPMIAVFIFFFLSNTNWTWKRLGTLGVKVFISILTILLVMGIFTNVKQTYITQDISDTEFPAMHWIAMASYGMGEYNIVDETYTRSLPTKEEKTRANLELYKERVKEQGVLGYGKHLLYKIKTTFSDASSGYRSELGVSQEYNSANLYLLGAKSDFIGFLCQINYLFCVLFAIVSIVFLFMKRKASKEEILLLTVVGAMLFHMLWEGGAIYLTTFWIMFVMVGAVGIELFFQKNSMVSQLNKIASRNVMLLLKVMMLISSAWLFIYLSDLFTKEIFVSNDAVVNQFIYQLENRELLLDDTYEQSFYANRKFNRLSLQTYNPFGKDNSSKYQATVYNQKEDLLVEYIIDASEIGAFDVVTFPIEKMRIGEWYYLKIKKVSGDDEQGISFLKYNTGNYDAYQKGRLYYNGVELERADLAFSVYNTIERPYISKVIYRTLGIIILLLEAAILIFPHRLLTKDRSQ